MKIIISGINFISCLAYGNLCLMLYMVNDNVVRYGVINSLIVTNVNTIDIV